MNFSPLFTISSLLDALMSFFVLRTDLWLGASGRKTLRSKISILGPAYSRLAELHTFVPPPSPIFLIWYVQQHPLKNHQDVVSSLEMINCVRISHSPDRTNIFYEVQAHTDMSDFSVLLSTLQEIQT